MVRAHRIERKGHGLEQRTRRQVGNAIMQRMRPAAASAESRPPAQAKVHISAPAGVYEDVQQHRLVLHAALWG